MVKVNTRKNFKITISTLSQMKLCVKKRAQTRSLPSQHKIQKAVSYDTAFCILCWDPGSNWGPFALQANALPTELSQHIIISLPTIFLHVLMVYLWPSHASRRDSGESSADSTCVLRLLTTDIFAAEPLELSQHIIISLPTIFLHVSSMTFSNQSLDSTTKKESRKDTKNLRSCRTYLIKNTIINHLAIGT
jgi:hypothetical protein